MRADTFILVILTMAAHVAVSHAQVRVNLKLDESTQPLPGRALLCDKNYKCGLGSGEHSKVSVGEKDLLIKVSRASNGFYLVIDTNQNRKLDDEKRVFLRNSGTVKVPIRKWTAAKRYGVFPFEIVHEAPDETESDQFVLRPAYLASGTMKYAKCTSPIALLDMDFDGRFTATDSDRGTNLRIDRNNDGRFWGKDEHARTAEIVVFCGQSFLVRSLSNRLLVLEPTNLRLARVDEKVPDFSIALLNGQVLNASRLKGKPYVLDFWASWCVPCVKNLPQIESVRKEYAWLSVFSINVDHASRRSMAQKIIQDNGIKEFAAIRGLGDDDPIWKIFGGANLNRLAIPLYVLVDSAGVVRYAGDGGESLTELKGELAKHLSGS